MSKIVQAKIEDIGQGAKICFVALDNSVTKAFEVFLKIFPPVKLVLTLSDNRQVIIHKSQGPTDD